MSEYSDKVAEDRDIFTPWAVTHTDHLLLRLLLHHLLLLLLL